MRGNEGGAGERQHLHYSVFRRVRDIDNNAPFIHFGDGFAAKVTQAAVNIILRVFPSIRIGELAVAVVCEGHIAAATIMKVFDVCKV